ncbi:MAG: TonB-dependent receptor plug domain-containing protein [Kiritimatiellaeota bacterium]|nr:TonB-dependent receptor plug domain-containing protein [Kiritimatiellota bacterium]
MGVFVSVAASVQGATETDAARGEAEVAELAPVVVVASPIVQYEHTEKDGANSAVISREQIERLSARDLPTALRQVPGVSISRYGPIGAYGGGQGGSVYVRGGGTARPGGEVRIYTDGVPRESGVWGHPLMDIVPIDFAERVTVAKNPQPQRYAGTFGAVDVTTRRRLTEGHEGDLSIAYGRFNTQIASASAGGKESIFDYYAGASYKHSDGARDHGAADLYSGFARLGADITESDHLSYIFHYTDSWVRDPGPRGGPTPLRDRFNVETMTHTVRLDSEHEHVRGYALGYYEAGKIRWHKDHLTDGVFASPPGYSNTDWDNIGARAAYDFLIERLTLTAALDAWSEGGETWNINETTGARVWGYDGRFLTIAPYLGARYDFDVGQDWTLTPSVGARYYFNSAFDDELAPCAALTLGTEDLNFFVSHARGVHYPGVYVRGVSPMTWKTLNAETLDTSEAGVHVDMDEFASVHASVFHTEVRDRMDATSSGWLNTGRMRANGAEASLHVYPHQDVTLFAGATYMRPDTRPASRMPEATVTAGASWQVVEHVRWDVDSQYVTSQYGYSMREANPALQKIDDYVIFNTRLSLDLRAFSKLGGELYVALENFTDQRYEYFPGYPMPGIVWYTGMKLTF